MGAAEATPYVVSVLPEPPSLPVGTALLHINAADTHDTLIGAHFDAALDYIAESRAGGGTVLVHCWRGISRAATVVCAALMRHEEMSAAQALAHVQARRSCADPNPAFRTQLQIFERRGCARAISWEVRS